MNEAFFHLKGEHRNSDLLYKRLILFNMGRNGSNKLGYIIGRYNYVVKSKIYFLKSLKRF